MPKNQASQTSNNVSSKKLFTGHTSLLSKGLDFALGLSAVPNTHIIAQTAQALMWHMQSHVTTKLSSARETPPNLDKGG